MHTYRIYLPYFAQTNIEYYEKYDCAEFKAENDTAAFAQAEKWQHECEKAQRADGVKLCALDPCFMNHIEKLIDGEWVKVEF